jgi:hypothetical protein
MAPPLASPAGTAHEPAPWAALPAGFAQWWWKPRRGAADAAAGGSLLAQRSAAHLKAEAAGFGVVDAWHWADLALLSPARRLRCARLYAALLLSQAPMLGERLRRLAPADRRWALAIGSVQPVPRRLDWAAALAAHDDDALLAFAELGFWVQGGFPMLWDRLLQDLDAASRRSVQGLLRQPPRPRAAWPAGTAGRVRRCWSLAQKRMLELEEHDGPNDERHVEPVCRRESAPA